MEMSESFAALAASSGSLNLPPLAAARPLSFIYNIGAVDDGVTAATGLAALPVAESLLTDVPIIKTGIIDPMRAVLAVGDSYSYQERMVDGRKLAAFSYAVSTAGASNFYRAIVVEGLGHQYPNGSNHPLVMANLLWDFFKTQSLP